MGHRLARAFRRPSGLVRLDVRMLNTISFDLRLAGNMVQNEQGTETGSTAGRWPSFYLIPIYPSTSTSKSNSTSWTHV